MSYEITSKTIKYMQKACLLCDNSLCGYKVGCLLVEEKNSRVLIESWNERLPGNRFCIDGVCIREMEGLVGGRDIHKVCTIHAESLAIGKAAKTGVKTLGLHLYVSTFPCLVCAKLIASSGISKVFYMSKYTGEDYSTNIFIENDIEVVHIPETVVWSNYA